MSRSVLVVGGNRGIGRAIARRMHADGHRVAITYRDIAPEGLFGVRCDVTQSDEVSAALTDVRERQGAVEVLAFAAGIVRDKLLLTMHEEDFEAPLQTNLVGAYRMAKQVARDMLRTRWGRMVFVSSSAALAGSAGQANYAASKAGLVGFTRSLARELGGYGITANVVAPGLTDTDMAARLSEEQRAQLIAQVPAGRMARPDEVASAVAYLAGEDAGYVNGIVLPVDGGSAMGH